MTEMQTMNPKNISTAVHMVSGRWSCAQTTRSGYSKALEYEYRVKTVALGTLKRYSIISRTLYLE
jgi:hypothetical protein